MLVGVEEFKDEIHNHGFCMVILMLLYLALKGVVEEVQSGTWLTFKT